MKPVAVASATLLAALIVSETTLAQQITYEFNAEHLIRHNKLLGIRLVANEPIAVPIKQLQGRLGAPIDLGLSAPVENLRFVMFQDIPAGIKFSRGFLINNNWFVSSNDLEKISLINIQETTEPIAFEVLYFLDSKQKPIARGVVVVNFTEFVPGGDVLDKHEPQNPPTGSVTSFNIEEEKNLPSADSTISSEREAADMEQARVFLRNGDISSARRILEFMASQGSAKGARALAETYDANYLQNFIIAGLKPDIEHAKKWYKRAAELGDKQAVTRLSVLDGR